MSEFLRIALWLAGTYAVCFVIAWAMMPRE